MKKRLIGLLVVIVLLFSLPVQAKTKHSGFLHNRSTMIPVRGVFEDLGAQVNWQPTTQEVIISKEGIKIVLQVDNPNAKVNGETKKLKTPPIIKDGSTYLPLRFPAEILGGNVDWNELTGVATITYQGRPVIISTREVDSKPFSSDLLKSFSKTIKGANVTGVIIPKEFNLKPKLVVANGQVGTTQSLEGMAKDNNALVAVNGSFFGAYGGVPVPWNQLIKDGKVAHLGNTGSTFGFTYDGKVKLESLRIGIEGATNGSYQYPNNWYAFGLNHYPSETGNLAFLFTSDWGDSLGFTHGKQIVVENSQVVKIVEGEDVEIPKNGYVISLHGSEKYQEKRFQIGTVVEHRYKYQDLAGNEIDWGDVETGVGAGPTLIKNGKIVVNPEEEGFSDAKILSQSLYRSAIGVTAAEDIIIINTTATMEKLAEIMQELGVIHGMNLDGGGSAGIYLNGKYLTKPGRKLSNALIFVQ